MLTRNASSFALSISLSISLSVALSVALPAVANGQEGRSTTKPASTGDPKPALAAVEGGTQTIAPTISEESLHRHVRVLASEDFMGRGAGTEGAALAAAYLVQRWSASGIAPKGTDEYMQPFTERNKKLANVVGWIRGTDEVLRDEFVILGAHYDHLGQHGEIVFNGADDNASGCAVMTEVASAIATEGGCRRSILVIAFDSEERGLRGSRYYATNPTVDKDAIAAMINMDMVSRGETGDVRACGTPYSPELKRALEAAAPKAGLTLHYDHEEKWKSASDHASFAKVGVPWLYIGVLDHEDYHKATDDADKSNKEKMLRIARMVYLLVKDVANQDGRPMLREKEDENENENEHDKA